MVHRYGVRSVIVFVMVCSFLGSRVLAEQHKIACAAGVNKADIKYEVRKATLQDSKSLKSLYQRVAAIPGGLARTKDEITDDYINKIVTSGVNKGLFFVAEYDGRLIGSMVKFRLDPAVFSHVLAEGSILVDPEFQGMGIGSKIISTFLKEVEDSYPEILRVEIIARESNPALKLYERLGFKREGRFESRIRGVSGMLEADIPMVWLNPKFGFGQKKEAQLQE